MFFSQSTHRKHWSFASDDELEAHRQTARRHYVWSDLEESGGRNSSVAVQATKEMNDLIIQTASETNSVNENQLEKLVVSKYYLTRNEENIINRHYAEQLVKKASQYKPPLPRQTLATAMSLYKRFYLHHTPMQFHPKEILVTCLFLSCKVDEHYISLRDFCEAFKGDKGRVQEIILNLEPLFMDRINYDFVVHLPYRPVEGLFIDMKTRSNLWPTERTFDAEKLRPTVDKFLHDSMYSDAVLLFSPSQIALAAVVEAADAFALPINSYITNKLCTSPTAVAAPVVVEEGATTNHLIKTEDDGPTAMLKDSHRAARLLAVIDTIRTLVKTSSQPDKHEREVIKRIETKIEGCRDPLYTFGTPEYQARVAQLMGLDATE